MATKDQRFAKQKVVVEPTSERFKKYMHMFDVAAADLQSMYSKFMQSCEGALAHTSSSNGMVFKDTCVPRALSSENSGKYYALSIGSDHVSVALVKLHGRGIPYVAHRETSISELGKGLPFPNGLKNPSITASIFFDRVAAFVKHAVSEIDDTTESAFSDPTPAGLAFEFNVDQNDVDCGTLLSWDSGFETGRATNDPVENGPEICDLMNNALLRADVPIAITALLTRATGVLVASYAKTKYDKRPLCGIGLVLDSRINISYGERKANLYGYSGRIINTECGDFAGLMNNIIDLQVDAASDHPGTRQADKMISGTHLPEIIRRTLIRIFRSDTPNVLWCPNALSLDGVLAVAFDRSTDHRAARLMADGMLEWKSANAESIMIINEVVRAVVRRSAYYVAIMISAIASRMGKLQRAVNGVTVGLDGSFFTRSPQYLELVKEGLRMILGDEISSLVHFDRAEDAASVGAAILAAHNSTTTPSRSLSFF